MIIGSMVLAWWLSPLWLVGVPTAVLAYWLMRRETSRRLASLTKPFPDSWEAILRQYVSYYVALNESDQLQFRRLMMVFLDEVTITGVRTNVDDVTRVLVAASAVIPIFRLDGWEYSRLGEVLIYPDSFDANYRSDTDRGGNILGMVGVAHLSGVMILSKPSLIAGFQNDRDKRNVGIHEFAHLVDKQDGEVDGVPAGVAEEIYRPWIEWVGRELADGGETNRHIDGYAFTNEAEYFAVLSEYFFENPLQLKQKNPELYGMLEKMYRQDTTRLLGRRPTRRRRIGRNDPCPCGSGLKFKRCCRKYSVRGW